MKCIICRKEIKPETTCCKHQYTLTEDGFLLIKRVGVYPEYATAEKVKHDTKRGD